MSPYTLTFPGPVPPEGGSIYSTRRVIPKPDYAIDDNGCWIWQKSLSKQGYAQATPHGKAHRVYYQLANGPIGKGVHVHHLCRETRCVNPAHLEAPGNRVHQEHHFLHENAGITLDDVREIRRLGREAGQSAIEIGERYGIAKWTVYNYWLGRKWTDLLGEDGPVSPPPWPCVECGGPVVGNRSKQYCGSSCKNRARDRRARARGRR